MFNCMKKEIYLLLVLGFIASCGNNDGPEAPDSVKQDKPVEVAIFQTYGTNESGLDKPHSINMNTRQIEKDKYGDYKKCVAHMWSTEAVYLIGYCIDAEKKKFEYEQTLSWRINGADVYGHYLTANLPDENCIVEYKVEVSIDGRKSFADRLIITVVPPATVTNFNGWYIQENNNRAWLSELPRPYSPLYYPHDPEPQNITPQRWREEIEELNTYLHIAGSYDIRSLVTSGGHGHQAVYDSDGKIISSGASAGTADKLAPYHFPDVLNPLPHISADVLPFVWACQLDGNPCQQILKTMTNPIMYSGANLNRYLEVRPPIADNPITTIKPTPTDIPTVAPTPTALPTKTPTPTP